MLKTQSRVEIELDGLQNPSLHIWSCLEVLKAWFVFLPAQAVAEGAVEPGSSVASASGRVL